MRRSSRGRTKDLLSANTTRPPGSGRRLLAGIVAVALALPAIFVGGEYLQRQVAYRLARAGDDTLKPVSIQRPLRDLLLNARYELPFTGRRNRLLESGLPVYELRIARKNMALLQKTAERVTARSTPGEVIPRNWLPARFHADGEWVRVEVKLRGEYAYHYLKQRPSLRIEFPKKRLFEGKRRINLVEPYDKGLAADLATHWALREQGILTLDTRFVILRVNGETLGLYQEIEHFDRSLADREGRSEGYIFSGQGQLFGKEGTTYPKARRAIDRVASCYREPGVPAPAHCSDWGFVSEHFDTDRWARATALMALLKSKHGWAPDNLRLFWDPARGRFEPIPWDYGFYALDPASDPEGEADPAGYLGEPMLAIPEFRRLRDRQLWDLLTGGVEPIIDYANARFEELTPALGDDIRHLRLETDRKEHRAFVKQLRANRDYLLELFRRHEVRARWWPMPGGLRAELENRGKAFVELRGLRIAQGDQVRVLPLEAPLTVDGLWQGRPGRARLALPLPAGARVVGLELRNALSGEALDAGEIALAQGEGPPPEIAPAPDEPPLAVAVAGVRVDADRVRFGPGRVRLERDLTIPPSHRVILEPGLELEMGAGASLFVEGDLEARGRPERPIRVYGHPEWGGLLVQGTRTRPSRVHLEHVTVEGGVGDEHERTRFSGAFSVYDGIVVMRNARFLHGRAEDGINLKYSQVDLRDNLFVDTADDSLDCDFCTGDVVGNRVLDSGGDAIDFSGSNVRVRGNVVERCADKGLSIGERTFALLEDNRVTTCRTGIAVKDLSEVTIRGAQLRDLEVGLALYVKKLSFGPSRARIQDVEMQDVESRTLVDGRCTLEELPAQPAGQRRASLR